MLELVLQGVVAYSVSLNNPSLPENSFRSFRKQRKTMWIVIPSDTNVPIGVTFMGDCVTTPIVYDTPDDLVKDYLS